MPKHAQLVAALFETGEVATQKDLADAINALRRDGGHVNQPRVSKWLNGIWAVGIEEAVCVELLTEGRQSAADYYPCIDRLLEARNERGSNPKRTASRTVPKPKTRIVKPLRKRNAA